ncbi:MAG: M20/M25/M40 family metallo-hydrolase, partial [Cyclobacteriaceae bacterium]
ANVLASQKDSLQGTVYFIFQPSEENIKGAKAMIDDGLFDLITPDETYALHMSPFPAGTIATKANQLYADYKRIVVTLKEGDNNGEAVSFVKDRVNALENIENPEAFNDRMTMGHPEMGISSANSIYKDYVMIQSNIQVKETDGKMTVTAYMNSSNPDQLSRAQEQLRQQLETSEYKDRIVSVDYSQLTYTIQNDPRLVEEALGSITSVYGQQAVAPLHGVVVGSSDDFALFQEQVPGVYFFLGGSDYPTGVISMPHAPNFNVDESSIKTGVQYFSSMIVERLMDE